MEDKQFDPKVLLDYGYVEIKLSDDEKEDWEYVYQKKDSVSGERRDVTLWGHNGTLSIDTDLNKFNAYDTERYRILATEEQGHDNVMSVLDEMGML